MNAAPLPIQKPAIPAVPPGARSLSVAYTGPVTRDETIGYIPDDTFSPLFVDTGHPDQPVVRPQPVLTASGEPTWATMNANLDLTPYSPWKKGAVGAAIGAGVGGVVGGVVGYFTGNLALGVSAGLGLGAAAGAGIGAGRVLKDQVTPDWELRPVVHHEFQGYNHTFMPQNTTIHNGKTSTTITTGYWHYYSADVDEVPVGNHMYWAPVARHSADA